MKKIDINNRVKVKLNPHGVDIFYHQFDETNKEIISRGGRPIEPFMPQIDKDGFTELRLWHFIELYGEHIGITQESVVTDICLYIEDKDLEEVGL